MKPSPRNCQHGSVLLAFVALLLAAMSFIIVKALNSSTEAGRNETNAAVLAQAKQALIGYAASIYLTGGAERPGDIPCPDRDNDGKAGTTIPLVSSCGSAAGSNQAQRLGRLPWKDLGLPDLRDTSGERLWYAVSNNFKQQFRTAILNSDTIGTITVRDAAGNIVNDGSTGGGVVAIIIAPGSSITRQDGLQQVRSAANVNNPLHFLDNIATEDNANFDEIVTLTNGFFAGPARDLSGNIISNDQIIVITRDEIMATVEKRVAHEAFNCLRDYAADPLNQGRLPWAAPLNPAVAPSYDDVSGIRFGRLPNTFINTVADSSGANPMKNGWTASCNLNLGTWWNNWREVVFYAVADAYMPKPAPSPSCGACLTINLPSTVANNKSFAVFMASKRLTSVAGGQPRTTNANKGSILNYLEDENATTADDIFEQSAVSATFNDATSFPPP